MFLTPNDRRFGFSVVGGSDEFYAAKIDDIAVGEYAGIMQGNPSNSSSIKNDHFLKGFDQLKNYLSYFFNAVKLEFNK